MLFSVLVDKMAGAKRGGADLAATTVESFFARFPTLHDFLLEQLRPAVFSLQPVFVAADEGGDSGRLRRVHMAQQLQGIV